MSSQETSSGIKRFIRQFVLELVIYAVLLTVYFLLVLRLLGEPLARLFNSNLTVYGIVALFLIVAQAVVLDLVTSLLVRWLNQSRQK